MSAATAGMIATLSMYGVSLFQILAVSMPAFLIGTLAGCAFVYKRGLELEQDPEFQRRVASGEYKLLHDEVDEPEQAASAEPQKGTKRSVAIFGLGVATVILFGTFKTLLPSWDVDGKTVALSTPMLIQMVMLAAALFIIVFAKVPSDKFASGSVFRSGLIGVVGVFGISWMTGTFFSAYQTFFETSFEGMVETAPMAFGLILFCFSSVIFSHRLPCLR